MPMSQLSCKWSDTTVIVMGTAQRGSARQGDWRSLGMLFPSKEQVQAAFSGFAGRNKRILKGQLQAALTSLGFDCNSDKVKECMAEVPSSLDSTSFKMLVQQLQSLLSRNEQVLVAFKLFDSGSKGHITRADLAEIASRVELPISEEELQHMLRAADYDGDGRIGISDFATLMQELELI